MSLDRDRQKILLVVLVILVLISWGVAIFSLLNSEKAYNFPLLSSKETSNSGPAPTGSDPNQVSPSADNNDPAKKTVTAPKKEDGTAQEIPVSGEKVSASVDKEFTLKLGDEAKVGDNLLLRIIILTQPTSSPGTIAIIAQAESENESVNLGFSIGKKQKLEEKALGYTYILKSATSKQATFLIKKI